MQGASKQQCDNDLHRSRMSKSGNMFEMSWSARRTSVSRDRRVLGGKISEMQNNPVELAVPNKLRILRENIQDNISHIEISNQMKKEIMSWGEQMKRETNTQIQSIVQGLLKQLEGV